MPISDHALFAQELQALVDWVAYATGAKNVELLRARIKTKYESLDAALARLGQARAAHETDPETPKPVINPRTGGYYPHNPFVDVE